MFEFIWYILFGLVIFTIGAYIWTLLNGQNKKKKLAQQLKEGREVTEREKIRVYMDNINKKFRDKRK
tara:strand:+ start:223 stop:423 length:201 start_codon:yes stop_codon:yes gene_type:complete